MLLPYDPCVTSHNWPIQNSWLVRSWQSPNQVFLSMVQQNINAPWSGLCMSPAVTMWLQSSPMNRPVWALQLSLPPRFVILSQCFWLVMQKLNVMLGMARTWLGLNLFCLAHTMIVLQVQIIPHSLSLSLSNHIKNTETLCSVSSATACPFHFCKGCVDLQLWQLI